MIWTRQNGSPNFWYTLFQKNGYTFSTVYSSRCVTVFLKQTLCDTNNNVLEHYGKELKSCKGALLSADLKEHGQFSQSANFCQKGQDGLALLGQPSKGHLCRISILFFHNVQKIGDLFWPGIFLDFRTVWSCTRSCTSCWMQQGFFAYFLLMMLRLDGEVCANRVKSKFLPRVWQVDAL